MTNLGDFRYLSFFFIPALPCRSSFPSSEIPNWKSLICLYQTDTGSIPGLGRSPGEGNDSLLQYSCLENPVDRGAWWATAHRVTKSQTWLSDFHFTFTLYSNISNIFKRTLWPCTHIQGQLGLESLHAIAPS